MNPKKIYLTVVCLFFIGAQFCAIIFPHEVSRDKIQIRYDKNFYPFLNYPMYAVNIDPEDQFIVKELRVYTGSGSKSIVVKASKLKIIQTSFRNLLNSAGKISDSTADKYDYQNIKILNDLMRKYISDKIRTAEIWIRSFKVNRYGAKSFQTPWSLQSSWKIN